MIFSGLLLLLFIPILLKPSALWVHLAGVCFVGLILLFFAGIAFYFAVITPNLFHNFLGLELSWIDYFKNLVELARNII